MADNVAVTAGVGTAIAADDVGSVFFQKIKLDLGTDGASAPALAGAGAVATGVQRVTLASDDPAITDLAAIEVLLGTMDTDTGNMVTALQLLDNAVDGNYLNVNLNVAGTDAAAGEGVISAQTQRVTLATDDDGVAHLATIAGDTTSLDTKVTACNTGAVVLATGSAAIGKLAAGVALIGKVGIDQVTANANEVVVKSGTVTTVSTVTSVTNLAQMGGAALNMGEGIIATGTQRVTLATDDDGVAHLATIAGDTTSLDTKVTACNTGAVVVASGAITVSGTVTADLSATDNAVLDSIVTNTAREVITGAGQAKLDHADVTTAQVLVAAVADKKFYITSMILSVAAAGSYWIEDDDAAQITCKYTLAANGGVVISFPIDTPYKSTTANKGLKVKGSAAGVIGCMITYYTLA